MTTCTYGTLLNVMIDQFVKEGLVHRTLPFVSRAHDSLSLPLAYSALHHQNPTVYPQHDRASMCVPFSGWAFIHSVLACFKQLVTDNASPMQTQVASPCAAAQNCKKIVRKKTPKETKSACAPRQSAGSRP